MLLYPRKLTITEKNPILLQILNEHIARCKNLRATQEEPDTVKINYLVASAPMKSLFLKPLFLMTSVFL